MRDARELRLRPRMQAAIDELKGLLLEHYPDATFRVNRSPDDPHSILLWTFVDVPDTTEVVDMVLDRVLAFQLEQHLPIHVVPARPHERVMEMLRAEQSRQPVQPT